MRNSDVTTNRLLPGSAFLFRGKRFRIAFVFAAFMCLPLCLLAQQTLPADASHARISVENAVSARSKRLRVPQDPSFLLATVLLDDLRQDEQLLSPIQNTILSARIGEGWIRVDPDMARNRLRSAVRALELQAQNGDPSMAAQRAEAVRILLKIIVPLDRLLGDRLLKLQALEPTSPPTQSVSAAGQSIPALTQSSSAPADNRWQQTRQFLDAAQSVIDQDPKLAANLARNIINLRGSKGVEILFGSDRLYGATLARNLFWQLRSADPATADRLFADAVSNARNDFDYSLIFSLSEIAFPTVASPNQQPLPASLQSAVLDLVSDAMMQAGGSVAGGPNSCGVSSIAARIAPFVDPSRIAGLQSAIDSCGARPANGDPDELNDALLGLKTSDDFWAAAETEPFLKKRVHYKMMAAIKALRETNAPVRALQIWDSFSPEERDAEPAWARDREEAAEKAVIEYYKIHDLRGVALAIEHTPLTARPQLQLKLASMLFVRQDRGLGIQMLADAKRTLEHAEIADPNVYLMLLTTYAGWLPAETPQAFTVAVAGLNRIPADPPAGEYWKPSRGYDFSPLQFGPSMLDMDPDFIRNSINILGWPVDRARFRLGYIQAALERYAGHQHLTREAAQAKSPKPQ